MPSAYPLLPADPPKAYIKPTLANTHGGKTYTSTHPGLFRVEFTSSISSETIAGQEGEESFSSRLVADRDFAAHEEICKLENVSLATEKAYSSVQFGEGGHDHFELNSDLLFMNHSCSPSVALHLPASPSSWSVRTLRPIPKGGDITFFYPSTEWAMAQGFDCACGSEQCLGRITGAEEVDIEVLERIGGVSDHVRRLKGKQ